MATEQPYRIDNCSPEFALGGRSIYTGDFIKLKGTEESKSSTVFIGKPSTVKGEVVVVDENFGVRITSIVAGDERLGALK